jgi:hypothetical protein
VKRACGSREIFYPERAELLYNYFSGNFTIAKVSAFINALLRVEGFQFSATVYIFVSVKKNVTCILLLLLIFESTALRQVFKIPTLVCHYLEHQQRDSRISVLSFLSMHYWGKDINDNDDDRDKQLPFKTVNIHIIQHSFVPPIKPIALKQVGFNQLTIKYPVLKDSYLSNPAISSLFKPPRA